MNPDIPKKPKKKAPEKEEPKRKPLSLDDLPAFDPTREQASTRPVDQDGFVEDLHLDGVDDD